MEKAKNVRRAAKGNLTRTLNAGKMLIQAKRPSQEVQEALEEIKAAYTDLVSKHEAFTMYLNDEEYAEAETWMDDCIHEYMTFSMLANDYTDGASEHEEHKVTVNDENNEAHSLADVHSHENEDNHSAELAVASAKPFVLKHEKPKLPSFHGDVRKYFIFRDGFEHAVENHCNARNTIAILRSCLGREPAKLIEGISSDLKAAWKYLDQNCGDPRVISDTVTADMERFKPIQLGEEHRFCDLVNLVRRLFNILKEVKRPQDIDNTHVISLIERKLTRDDLKIWARHINSQKLDPSMHNLISWMENEMTARLR